MSAVVYLAAGWLLLAGCFGVVRSRDLVHTVVCVSVAQSGTYVLLLGIGFQFGAGAPVQGSGTPVPGPVVDPVVQALTLTDIVVSATVTALLLSLVIQIAKHHDTVDPDQLNDLRG